MSNPFGLNIMMKNLNLFLIRKYSSKLDELYIFKIYEKCW